MAAELVPVVDLRVLSQSDLEALAAASAHAVAPRSCPEADPLPPLKIDRAVFNESAGSRKQTFSRLRLAAAAAAASSSSYPASGRGGPENYLIAYHLRRLFNPDDPSLPPPETLALLAPPPPDPDRETTNSRGVSVDLVRLGGMVDPYDGELKRRTAGMMSESELFGFISGLAGQWVSQRQRRKFVDASFMGDHLPVGWKLQLGLKRKAGTAWVHCVSYVSPKGNQFATCKEVSAYLMSLLGYPEAKAVNVQCDSTGQHDDSNGDAVGFQRQIGSSVDNQNVLAVVSANYECLKCNLTFDDQSSYAEHQISFHFHKTSAKKRRKTGKFGEPVVGKDGKFECPICHKTFEEQPRYFGHVGSHARYEGLTPETFLDKTSSGMVVGNSLTDFSFSLQELTGPSEQIYRISGGELGSQHHNSLDRHGDNNPKVTEVSTNSYIFNRANETWSRPEGIPLISDAPSAHRYTNNVMECADATITTSQPNDQLTGRINGFAQVTGFNDQMESHRFLRSTTFGIDNHYEGQIIEGGMSASNHGEANNVVKSRDVNLNSRLDTISFPIASANNETTSIALDEANRSSAAGKCFSGSFKSTDGASTSSSCSGSNHKISSSLGVANRSSNAVGCFSSSHGNDNGACKVNIFGNNNNTMVYQSHSSMRPVSPVPTNGDRLTSQTKHSRNNDRERACNAKERNDSMQSKTGNASGFGIEAYNNVFTGDIAERSPAQLNNSFSHIKHTFPSRHSPSEFNAPTASNLTKASDVNCTKGSFVNRSDANSVKTTYVHRPVSDNESHGAVHEVMGKPGNDMHNHYNNCAPSGDQAAASSSQNINSLMSMQANLDSMSSLARSVGETPMINTNRDQCDLQLGFGGQKQHIFPGYGELRPAAAGSSQLGAMDRNNSLPTGSSQFGSMVVPNSMPAVSSQFGSVVRPNFVQTGSPQFGSMARPNSAPTGFAQFGNMARPNSVQSESSQFGNMARPNSVQSESSQFGTMVRPNSVPPADLFGGTARQNFVSTPEPTLVLGYAPQMGSVRPGQLGWDLSLSRMVTGSMMTCVCVWCNSQFHHFGTIDGQQGGSFGFICPACKEKISAQRNMPNNGSWQP